MEIPAFEPGRITAVYQDQLWNVGNVWSVVRGTFPTIDSRFNGQVLGYHLFQSYLQATFTIISGTHALFIQNYYFAIADAFFIIFTIGLALKRFLKWSEKTILTFIFILLFTKGVGWYYHGHLYSNPLTFFHSLSSFCLFIIVMLAYLKEKKTSLFPLIIFAFAVMTGSKALLTILFLSTLLSIFCYKLIFKKASSEVLKKEFYLGISFGIVCIALKLMIFLNSRPLLINQGGDYSTFWRFINSHLTAFPHIVKNSIFLAYLMTRESFKYFANVQGMLFIIGAFFLGTQKKLKEYFNESSIFLIVTLIFCVIYESLIRYENSDAEIYFVWYGFIIVIFLFAQLKTYGQVYFEKSRSYRPIYLAAIFIGTSIFFFKLYQIEPWKNWLRNDSSETIGATITYDELQGMNWVYKNVKDDEVILSDRRSFPKSLNGKIVNRFFAYSGLSGKQFFIEGDDFNCCEDLERSNKNWENVFKFIETPDNREKEKLLASFKVDYFIQSQRFNKHDFSGVSTMKLVYDNPDIRIYKILKN